MKAVPFRRIVLPRTVGSLANSCFQKSGPSTTYGMATGHLVFVSAESASQPWLHAEHLEVVGGNHHSALDPWRVRGFGTEAHRLHIFFGDYAIIAPRFVANVQVFAIGERFEACVVSVLTKVTTPLGCGTG